METPQPSASLSSSQKFPRRKKNPQYGHVGKSPRHPAAYADGGPRQLPRTMPVSAISELDKSGPPRVDVACFTGASPLHTGTFPDLNMQIVGP